MYSDIWLPDLDSEKWLSSLLSIRLNWKKEKKRYSDIYGNGDVYNGRNGDVCSTEYEIVY